MATFWFQAVPVETTSEVSKVTPKVESITTKDKQKSKITLKIKTAGSAISLKVN